MDTHVAQLGQLYSPCFGCVETTEQPATYASFKFIAILCFYWAFPTDTSELTAYQSHHVLVS